MSESEKPGVIVVGGGYVGLATAAVLGVTWDGPVMVVDLNVDRNREHHRCLGANEDPLGEPGMADALHAADVKFYTGLTDELVRHAVVFACVGTPSNGRTIDCSAVRSVVIDYLARGARLVVIRSTVTPGFVADLLAELTRTRGDGYAARVAVAPEFLREGHAVEDALAPSRVVVGASMMVHHETVITLLDPNSGVMATRTCTVTPAEAALVKLGSNAMLSMRAWFADAVANACEGIPDADALRVLAAIGADDRIGPRHLRPGLGVAGPCLPKDLGALIDDQLAFEPLSAISCGLVDPVADLAIRIRGEAPEGPIVVWGCGFKPDSCDWRSSPAVELAIALSTDSVVHIVDHRLTDHEIALLEAELADRCAGDGLVPTVGRAGPEDPAVVVLAMEPPMALPHCTGLVVDPHRLLPKGHTYGAAYIGRGLGPT